MRFRTFKAVLLLVTVLTGPLRGGIPLWDGGLWAEKAGALYLAAPHQIEPALSLRCYSLDWSYSVANQLAFVRITAARFDKTAEILRFSCESPDLLIRINPHDLAFNLEYSLSH